MMNPVVCSVDDSLEDFSDSFGDLLPEEEERETGR